MFNLPMALEAFYLIFTSVFYVKERSLFDSFQAAGFRMTGKTFLLINLSFSFNWFFVTIKTIHARLYDWLMIEFNFCHFSKS